MYKTIKVVIGSNFGDEGKGLMTDYFAFNNTNSLIIRFNGGCQAGHTVVTPKGQRHVFGHFGSGSFIKCPTYLSSYYIANPMIFIREYKILKALGFRPLTYINPECMVTTPYDMLINQSAEKIRGKNKHGSCGLGVYETVIRNMHKDGTFHIKVKDLFNKQFLYSKLKAIRNIYVNYRFREIKIDNIQKEYQHLFQNQNILDNFINDIDFMLNNVVISDDEIMKKYNSLIFEGAQGLLLDNDNLDYYPYLTPSKTGLKNASEIINKNDFNNSNIEVCYVTRSYTTRHGVGIFNTECDKEKIIKNYIDKTNVYNEFQDNLRYGYLDTEQLLSSIKTDLLDTKLDIKPSLSITHMDETNNMLVTTKGNIKIDLNEMSFKSFLFNKIYISNGETRDYITNILQ